MWSLFWRPAAVLGAVLGCLSGAALAQSNEDGAATDKSGTNPAVLTRSLNVSNDFRALQNGRWYNNPTLRFTQPFNDERMSLSAKVPVPSTNLPGKTQTGLGDISAKWTWVAHLDRRQGLILSAEITAPTARNTLFGSGKWVVAPGITYAWFVSPEWIVAPALVHNLSFAGESNRARVNRTDFDLYVVYKPKGQNWWLTSDLTVGYDYIAKTTPATFKLALGTNLGKINDAAVNLSIRPGVGIGRDRPANWSLEVGLAVVGF